MHPLGRTLPAGGGSVGVREGSTDRDRDRDRERERERERRERDPRDYRDRDRDPRDRSVPLTALPCGLCYNFWGCCCTCT